MAIAALKHELCNRCLGRLFARLGRGIDNEARGKIIRYAAEKGISIKEALKKASDYLEKAGDYSEHSRCEICEGIMERLDTYAQLILSVAEGVEFRRFLVGSRVAPEIIEREEELWAEIGTEYYEPIKSEINREVGKRVARALGTTLDREKPEVVFIVDTEVDNVIMEIRSVYILGRYKKLVRGIPQTRWPCRVCRGLGCERCNYTGKMYQESVEEIIAKKIVEFMEANGHRFHGMGREDIDARMLGNGRPFIIEIREPKKRYFDLKYLEEEVNAFAQGKVEVSFYRYASREDVVRIKSLSFPKTYLVVVEFEGDVEEEKLKEVLNNLSGRVIRQRTPLRVAHRRADKVRERKVIGARLRSVRDGRAEIEITAEAGTYIKELVHGDAGRTTPSIAEMLGVGCNVISLDVIKIHDEVSPWLEDREASDQ